MELNRVKAKRSSLFFREEIEILYYQLLNLSLVSFDLMMILLARKIFEGKFYVENNSRWVFHNNATLNESPQLE